MRLCQKLAFALLVCGLLCTPLVACGDAPVGGGGAASVDAAGGDAVGGEPDVAVVPDVSSPDVAPSTELVSGVVTDATSSGMIAGATVCLEADAELCSTTDGQGGFSLETPPGTVALVVSAAGYRAARAVVDNTAGAAARQRRGPITAGGALRVRGPRGIVAARRMDGCETGASDVDESMGCRDGGGWRTRRLR